MAKYKNVLTGYVNTRQSGEGQYLVLKNVSEEDVVIGAGEKIFLNRTPESVLEEHPKVPNYSMSVKMEDESNDIPF